MRSISCSRRSPRQAGPRFVGILSTRAPDFHYSSSPCPDRDAKKPECGMVVEKCEVLLACEHLLMAKRRGAAA